MSPPCFQDGAYFFSTACNMAKVTLYCFLVPGTKFITCYYIYVGVWAYTNE